MNLLIFYLALLFMVGLACLTVGYQIGINRAAGRQVHVNLAVHPAPEPQQDFGIWQGDGGAPKDVDLLRQFLPPSGLRTFDIQAFTSDILEEPVDVECIDCPWAGPGHELAGLPFTSYEDFELSPAHRCPGCGGGNLMEQPGT